MEKRNKKASGGDVLDFESSRASTFDLADRNNSKHDRNLLFALLSTASSSLDNPKDSNHTESSQCSSDSSTKRHNARMPESYTRRHKDNSLSRIFRLQAPEAKSKPANAMHVAPDKRRRTALPTNFTAGP